MVISRTPFLNISSTRFKPAFERYAVLHGEHGGHFPCGAVLFDVRIAEHGGDEVRVLRKLRLIAGGRLSKYSQGPISSFVNASCAGVGM